MITPKISNRERHCLSLIANGQTTRKIAEFLNVKPSTVETWRKNIKQKLGCATIAQAVFEGVRYGYLSSQSNIDNE